jgi:predicted MFS family arabinose efflux permease
MRMNGTGSGRGPAGPRRNRWSVVAAYCAASSANQMLWLTFAPVTTVAAHHYGVPVSAVGWMAEVFPLVYVVLALPAGALLDRWFRGWLGIGALLTAAGAVARVGGGFERVLAGQVIIAIAQPFVLNALTKVAGEYLEPDARPTGIALGSASIFGGFVLALVLGTVLSQPRQIWLLVLIGAVYASIAALALVLALRHPGHREGGVLLATGPQRLQLVWSDPVMRTLAGLVLAGFGVFVALSTWLQALLKPAGVSASAAGVLLVEMVLAGVAGSALLPPLVARHRAEARLLTLVVVVTAAGCLILAVAPGILTGAIVMFFVGALLLTALPVVLEIAERRAGDAGATATALLWLAGNAGGLAVALVVQGLENQPIAAFAVMAATITLALPLTQRWRFEQPAPVALTTVTGATAFGATAAGATAGGATAGEAADCGLTDGGTATSAATDSATTDSAAASRGAGSAAENNVAKNAAKNGAADGGGTAGPSTGPGRGPRDLVP